MGIILKKRTVLIITITLVISFAHFLGLYGFGSDFRHTYQYIDYPVGRWNDYLGYWLASLGDRNYPFGVFIVAFLVLYSSAKIFFYRMDEKSVCFALPGAGFVVVILAHIWPAFMAYSNVMRQGILMSLLFLSLLFLDKKRYVLGLFFCAFLLFSHKSSLFFLVIIFSSLIIYKVAQNAFCITPFLKKILMCMGGFLCFIVLWVCFYLFIGERPPSRVIGGDYSLVMFVLSLFWVFFYVFSKENISFISSFLVVYVLASSVFLIKGLLWEYERFIMIVSILLILWFPFPKLSGFSIKSYMYFCFLGFLVITFLAGVYSSYKNIVV